MQGAGNDYIYVNCFEEKVSDTESTAVKVRNRQITIIKNKHHKKKFKNKAFFIK